MKTLIDHHIHLGYGDFRKENRSTKYINTPLDSAYNNLLQYVGTPIKELRDGSDKEMLAFQLKAEAADLGIKLLCCGRGLVKKECYGRHLGYPLNNMDDLKGELNFLAEKGVDCFKVVQSGLVDMTGAPQVENSYFNDAELLYIREFANHCHIPVMVHVNFPNAIESIVDVGMDSIEHGYFITEELLKKMQKKGVAWTPTLAPFANTLVYDRWIKGWDRTVVKNIVATQRKMVKRGAELGVKILVGSDAGSSIVPHGSGTLDEHRLLQEIIGDSYE
ncbi:MAG: amidohydrolase family protein [Clostridiales bacterium]